MSDGSRSRVLATVRHPGPTHCLGAVLGMMPELDWYVAADSTAARVLRDSYPELLDRVVMLDPPPKAVDPADVQGLSALAKHCEVLIDTVRPDAVLRTTPSVDLGLDELIATAVRGRFPVVAVQDFPGLGGALWPGTSDATPLAPDLIITPSDSATASLDRMTPTRVVTGGWMAHDRFHRATPYEIGRAAERAALHLSEEDTYVVIVGSGPDVGATTEMALVAEVAGLGELLPHRSVRHEYRPHPRRRLEDTTAIRRSPGGDHPVQPAGPPFLAAPDVIVSRASVLNLEAMAYAATWGAPRPPLSVYILDDCSPIIDGYWAPAMPHTHLPGGGSLTVRTGTAGEIAAELRAGRPTTSAGTAMQFVFDPARMRSVLEMLHSGR